MRTLKSQKSSFNLAGLILLLTLFITLSAYVALAQPSADAIIADPATETPLADQQALSDYQNNLSPYTAPESSADSTELADRSALTEYQLYLSPYNTVKATVTEALQRIKDRYQLNTSQELRDRQDLSEYQLQEGH